MLFSTQAELAANLTATHAIGAFKRKLARVPLLIVDDFGLKPMRPTANEDFHDLIAGRYEQAESHPGKDRRLRSARRHGMIDGFIFIWSLAVARVCQVTGKTPMVGNQVSHANNKTKRRFLPNLQYRRFWSESRNSWVRLRVSNAGLRTIDKRGIDAVLAELQGRGEI